MISARHFVVSLAAAALYVALAPAADAQTADDLYKQGVEARLEQKFDEAAGLLRRVLALQPQNSDALVQLGFVELGRGDLAAARAAFSQALAIAPAYADAKFGMAQIEFRSGNTAAALAILEPLAKEQSDNQEVAALLANVRNAMEASPAEPAEPEKPPRAARRDPIAPLMDEGRRLRTAGQFAEAESVYHRALSLAPRNTDVLVALGLVSGFQQKFEESGRFFDRALAIDPDNSDARLGKVRLALWQGDVAGARRLIGKVLPNLPGNAEAMVLDARVALLERDYDRAEQVFAAAAAADPASAEALLGLGDARRARGDETAARQAFEQALELEPDSADIALRLAAPLPRKWRLDIGSEVSNLSNNLGTWTDSGISLAYRLDPDTVVGARTRVATRFGRTDVQIEARIDHAFSPSFSAYGVIAATPDANFLASFSIGSGASWRAFEGTSGVGPVFLNLDARYDLFETSEIGAISPWLQAYFFDGRLGLAARWLHAQDDGGRKSDGYVLRTDLGVTDRLRLFGGYSDAPEISEGTLVPTRTAFGGAFFDVADTLTLVGSYSREERPTFSRDTFGLGLAVRF